MNYADIKEVDIQDGEGVRVSLYVSGCHFHCKGCHNKEAWDFNYGKKFTDETIDRIINLLDKDYITGLSLLGGEPLEPVNQQGLVELTNRVKEKFPNKTIWSWTGFLFDRDLKDKEVMKYIDVLVDGQYKDELHDFRLKYRGSSNQRVINVKESLKQKKTILLDLQEDFIGA